MKKICVLILLLSLNISILSITAYEPVSSQVQTATTFLQPRPASSRTSSTLTLTQLNSFFNTVKTSVNTARVQMYDVDHPQIDLRISQVEAQLSGLTQAVFGANYAYYYDIYEELFSIYALTIESKVVEGRGMWHRPFESNLNQVIQTLTEMKQMGVNMLYVETFWMGRLIYPSQIPNTHQHGFTTATGYNEYGNNLLLAFVEEGKKMGIEVHAWVENFFVGYGTSYLDSPILAQKKEWASYNFDGSIPQRTEQYYLFMDPAHPEVRRYLKAIYAEIVTLTDAKSIHLDYIRYPVAKNVRSSNPVNNLDTGYSDFAEADFKNKYGLVGDLRQLVVASQTVANQWKAYKTQVISDFVAGVYYTVKNTNPNVTLSTAIFGNVENALSEKMQDWNAWTQDGFIEIIMPMSYYQSSSTVGSETNRLTNLVGQNAYSYAGIAPTYMGFNAHLNTTQIQAALSNGAQGTAFFASQFYMLSKNDYPFNQKQYALEVQDVLAQGVFRNEAILPHEAPNLVIETQLNYTLDKATRIYHPRGSMTLEQKDNLATTFSNIINQEILNMEDLSQIISELKSIVTSTYASGAGRTRIAYDINQLVKILEIHVKRSQLDNQIDLSINPDPDELGEPSILNTPVDLTIHNQTLTWSGVDHAIGYIVYASQNGSVQTFHVTQASFDLTLLPLGDFNLHVKARGDQFFYTDSVGSNTISHSVVAKYLDAPLNVYVDQGVILFDPVDGALSYEIFINQTEFLTTNTTFNLNTFNLRPGVYQIKVRALGNQQSIFSSEFSLVYTYEIKPILTEEEKLLEQILKEDVRAWILYILGQK